MSKCSSTILQWVVVEGVRRHVSDFHDLRPGNRPPALCPVCGAPVILKIGTKVSHHVAHKSDSTCVASTPEGAIHYNTKMYLCQKLRTVSSVSIVQACVHGTSKIKQVTVEDMGLNECPKERVMRWWPMWDEVRVEEPFGAIVADILLLRSGVPVGIIEVCATHAVDMFKAQALQLAGIPWIEVKADTDIYDSLSPWTPAMPLRLLNAGGVPPWICPSCGYWIDKVKHLNLDAQESYIESFKVLDVYWGLGAWTRDVIVVRDSRGHKTGGSVWIGSYNNMNTGRTLTNCASAPPDLSLRETEYDALLKSVLKMQSGAEILDTSGAWHFDRNPKVGFVESIFPARWKWNSESGKWVNQSTLRKQ